MGDSLSAPLAGTVKLNAEGPLLACHYPENGPIVVIALLRSDPPDSLPDHDASQRAYTFLKYEIGKGDGEAMTVTKGFWPISGSADELCIIAAT